MYLINDELYQRIHKHLKFGSHVENLDHKSTAEAQECYVCRRDRDKRGLLIDLDREVEYRGTWEGEAERLQGLKVKLSMALKKEKAKTEYTDPMMRNAYPQNDETKESLRFNKTDSKVTYKYRISTKLYDTISRALRNIDVTPGQRDNARMLLHRDAVREGQVVPISDIQFMGDTVDGLKPELKDTWWCKRCDGNRVFKLIDTATTQDGSSTDLYGCEQCGRLLKPEETQEEHLASAVAFLHHVKEKMKQVPEPDSVDDPVFSKSFSERVWNTLDSTKSLTMMYPKRVWAPSAGWALERFKQSAKEYYY